MMKQPSRAGLPGAIEHLARDIGYGWRGLWRDPTFALTTVTTLAVALALVTAAFAVFNAYVLRPYAVRDPYSLHEIRWRSQDAGGRFFQWRDYQELQAMEGLFDGVIAERNRTVASESRRLLAAFVSGNYFETLGGRIRLGRGLADFDAAAPGSAPVAVLSHDAWRRLFDRDPDVVGRELRLNGAALTVVGVAREEFTGLTDTPPDLWTPVTMHGEVIRQELLGADQPPEVAVIGRLRAGVTAAQAEAALSPLMQRIAGRSDLVRAEVLLQATPAPLTLELLAVLSPVFAAFVLVLFAASANVSNVMLARGHARQREIGIRLSVGASRGRVLRQLLTEGLLVAALAGIAGLAIASLVLRTGLTVFFAALPPSAASIARAVPLYFDHRVFLFTFAVAGAATVLFALLPAFHATRLSLTTALRGELGHGVRGSTLRSILVVGQVAVSLVLLVAAATLLRNGTIAASTDLGLDTAGVVSVRQRAQGSNMIPAAAALLAADPRIASVAVTSRNPLLGELPKLRLQPTGADHLVAASYMFVSPEYFETVRIPIVRGRGFSADEGRSEAKVAIVSATAARRLWPGADPVGRSITVLTQQEVRIAGGIRAAPVSPADLARTSSTVVVVGIAGDVVNGLVYDGRDFPHIYQPTSPSAPQARSVLLRARSRHDLRPDAVETLLQKVHPSLLAFETLTLEEALALQLFPLTVASWIGLVLSGIALALSVSGIYGVVTYALSQRTREIGIRMALGSTAAGVVRLLMTQSARLVAIGAGAGFILSFVLMAALRTVVRMDNVSVLDAGAFAASAAVIGAAAGLATYIPARRAARIEPSETLRADG